MDYLILLRKNKTDCLDKYIEVCDTEKKVQGNSLLYWDIIMNNLMFSQKLINYACEDNNKDCMGRSPLSIAS